MRAAIERMEQAGFRLMIKDGRLLVHPAGKLTPEQRAWLKAHKAEIIAELQRRRPGNGFAVLMELPDGFRYWLAPDGMEFDTGGLPVIRRSVLDKLEACGADVRAELRALFAGLRELGGELSVLPENAGSEPLPAPEKRASGEMSAPVSREVRP